METFKSRFQFLGGMGIANLLVDWEDPGNIGRAIRTNHVLGGGRSKLYIYDPKNLFITRRKTIYFASTGVSRHRIGIITPITDLGEFLKDYDGRIIKTDIVQEATPLNEFRFNERDLVLYGNETFGYGGRIAKHLEKVNKPMHAITVPMLGEPYKHSKYVGNTPQYANLNVAATLAIVTFTALSQLGYFDGFNPSNLRTI